MAVKTYIAREGQSIYDLAIFLYSDSRGVGELTRLNPTTFLDLNALDYQGQLITYEDDKRFTIYVSPENAILTGLENYSTLEGQSVYDVAIQLYGDISDGLSRVISHYQDMDAVPPVNIEIPRTRPDNPIGNLFNNNANLVATIGSTIGLNLELFDDTFDDTFE